MSRLENDPIHQVLKALVQAKDRINERMDYEKNEFYLLKLNSCFNLIDNLLFIFMERD